MRTLSPRTLREIRGYLCGAWNEANSGRVNGCIAEIDRVLAANISRGKRLAARTASKLAERRPTTAEIRCQCVKRSEYTCENCGKSPLNWALELDHFYGGSGRRLARESVDTCWMLCRPCHRAKTNNSPSAAYWRQRFADHCARIGVAA